MVKFIKSSCYHLSKIQVEIKALLADHPKNGRTISDEELKKESWSFIIFVYLVKPDKYT